jgi:hypothetical protein
MASAGKVGRNGLCTCGSGKKYKLCCKRKVGTLSPLAWIAIVGIAAATIAVLAFSFTTTTSSRVTSCPPGQAWSMDHGHCH